MKLVAILAPLALVLLAGACTTTPASPTATPTREAAAPTRVAATPTRVAATPTRVAVSTTVPTVQAGDEVSKGSATWGQQPCLGCHGDKGQGGVGPKLAGTKLAFDRFKDQIRNPREIMPAFSENQLSDSELQSIYKWLTTLNP